MKKLNNNGFTLIELIAVIGILLLVLLIAIPNVTKALNKRKTTLNDEKKDVILSAAEIYYNMYLNDILKGNFRNGRCGISADMLLDKNLITDEELKNSNGNYILAKDTTSEVDKLQVVYYSSDKYILDTTKKYSCYDVLANKYYCYYNGSSDQFYVQTTYDSYLQTNKCQ